MKQILMVLLVLAASRPLAAQSPADGEKGGQPFLDIGMSCSAGDACVPGGFCDLEESYCRCFPRTATALVNVGVDPAGFVPALRFGLAINRCTDHLAVAHWENDDLVLRFFTRTGAPTGAKFYFDKNRGWGVNPGCGNGVIRRCGLGTPDCKNASATEATPMCQGIRYNLRAKISQVQP